MGDETIAAEAEVARDRIRSSPWRGSPRDTLSLDNTRLCRYAIYVVVSNAMPLPRFSTMIPARVEALAAALRNPPGRTSFDRTEIKKILGFKARMLLKIGETRTIYTNSEWFFRRISEGFAIFRTNCSSLARVEVQVSGVACQVDLPELREEGVSAARKKDHLSLGSKRLQRSSLFTIGRVPTTPDQSFPQTMLMIIKALSKIPRLG